MNHKYHNNARSMNTNKYSSYSTKTDTGEQPTKHASYSSRIQWRRKIPQIGL